MHELFEITNYNISSGRNAILFRSLLFSLWFPGVYQNKIKQTKKPETEHSLISENIWKRNVITSLQFPQDSSFCLFISMCTAAAILVVYILVLRWAVTNRTAISRTPTAATATCTFFFFYHLPVLSSHLLNKCLLIHSSPSRSFYACFPEPLTSPALMRSSWFMI